MGDHEGTLQIEYDFSMKIKLVLTRFGSTFGTLRFDEIFLNTILRFTTYWYYKPTDAIHGDRPGVYTSDAILTLSILNKIHLKCDIVQGSKMNGKRQTIVFSFV